MREKKWLCNFTHDNSKCWMAILIVCVILLVLDYICAYLNLNTNLLSAYDEGFFYLILQPLNLFTVDTKPLSLSTDILCGLFPFINDMDILSLRQLAFWVQLSGMLILLSVSMIYINKLMIPNNNYDSYLVVIISFLIVGLYVLPGEVINLNNLLLFFTSLILSFTLLFLLIQKWIYKVLLLIPIGFLCILAILTNTPGGGMVLLICSVFLVLYDNVTIKKIFVILTFILLGICVGILYVHTNIITLSNIVDFVQVAFQQSTAGGVASHHSIDRIILVILFGIRDLLITTITLCGLIYVYRLFAKTNPQKWILYLVMPVLFFILVKWMIKPQIYVASVVAWFLVMFFADKNIKIHKNDVLIILLLFLLPLVASFGTNSNLLNKSLQNILPWGLLLSILYTKGKERNPIIVRVLLLVFYVYVLIVTNSIHTFKSALLNKKENNYCFAHEAPIARMNLNIYQAKFYDEVYDVLRKNGYVAGKDTLLGFCFNEMTVVAMDAIPYTNDQLPEEFLRHDLSTKPSPSYMILSEWDSVVLYNHFQQLDWNFPNGYKKIKLSTNPDPHSGFDMTQSSVYIKQESKIINNVF